MKSIIKKSLSCILCLAMIVSMMQIIGLPVFADETSYPVWDGTEDSNLRGGGTASDPYLIETAEQLAYLVSDGGSWQGYYKLTTDIYLNDISKIDWETGTVAEGYTPNEWYTGEECVGIVDGDGHTVYGLYSTSGANAGLFPTVPSWCSYAVSISNLGIDKAYISSTDTAAAFVGSCTYNTTVNFTNCYAGKDVKVVAPTAAVFTAVSGGTVAVDKCYSLATTDGSNTYGIIGNTWGGGISISNSYFANTIVTSKVSDSIPCTNVYVTSGTGVKAESTAVIVTDENMQGKDALVSADKMSGLADCGFVATNKYPVLAIFPYVEEEDVITVPVWDGSVDSNLRGGGTDSDPYLIETAEQLAFLVSDGGNWQGYYKLTTDIYLNDISKIDWETGTVEEGYTVREWYTGEECVGIVDGDGHTVYGLYSTSGANAGLFPTIPSWCSYAVSISNLGIDKAYISSTDTAAAFVGSCTYNTTVNFTNCYAGKDVKVVAPTAAVITAESGGTVTVDKCYSLATTEGSSVYGIIGNTWGGGISISNSYFANTIVTSKVSDSIPCSNVYVTSGTGVKAESTAVIVTDENMQGKDALVSADKMSGLAEYGFVATNKYPVLAIFPYVEEEEVITVPVWDGTQKEPTQYEDGVCLITCAEELAYVINNEGYGVNYRLTTDIYLNDITKIDWTTGTANDGYTPNQWYTDAGFKPFCAPTIDGDGHTVYGLYSTGGATAGLIPVYIAGWSGLYSMNVTNLGVDYAYISATDSAAAFAGSCNYNNTVNFTGCYAGENVTVIAPTAAVFVAVSGGTVAVDKCYSLAKVEGGTYGIIGNTWGGGISISNSYFANTIVTSKVSDSIPCTNVYVTNGTGIKDESTAVIVTDENMQGFGALIASTKMPGLANLGFKATASYPVLKMFAEETEEYIIYFDANGGVVDTEYVLAMAGEVIELPTPTKDGYIFKGWYTDADLTVPATNVVPAEDTVYYAKWYIRGDVNKDGTVNITDIARLRNAILNNEVAEADDFSLEAANCNDNDIIDAVDVVILKKSVAGVYDFFMTASE